jgi:hypothetical protein
MTRVFTDITTRWALETHNQVAQAFVSGHQAASVWWAENKVRFISHNFNLPVLIVFTLYSSRCHFAILSSLSLLLLPLSLSQLLSLPFACL